MAYTDIDDPTIYFNTKLYTGTGSAQNITGVGFQPDWIFLKPRSQSGEHGLSVDSVRGNTKVVFPNLTNPEQTITNIVTAFGSDGFSLGDNAGANNNTSTYVAWNWKAGTSFTNDASSTGIGTIDSSGSVSTDAGFSICSWVGTGSNGTIKHGLSTVPEIMIIKNTGHDTNWSVYTKPTGELGELRLNNTDAFTDDDTLYNDTAPTSSVFSVGTNYNTNHSDGRTYIGYIFSSVKGYSKFGSYTGNGSSSEGPFIYLGFKPAWIMIKRTDDSANWCMYDNKRSPFNVSDDALVADDSVAEYADNSGMSMDYTAQGFKIRGDNSFFNTSGSTYIYMAFAENPFVTSTGIPTTAR